MAAAAPGTVLAGPLFSLPPSFNLIHPDLIQWPTFTYTRSVGNFSKEPLHFSIFEPTVHDVFFEYVFSFRKRRFPLLDSKYVFSIYRFATDFVLLIKTLF